MNTNNPLEKEFDRQLDSLVLKGYATLAGYSEEDFRKTLEKLRIGLKKVESAKERDGYLPFVIVIKHEFVPTEAQVLTILRTGMKCLLMYNPGEIETFVPTPEVTIPPSPAYLLIDIDRGKETLNVAPNQALTTIKNNGRSPLTVEEGIAIMTQFPDFLVKNNCFSLLGSRCGDKRVPAFWLSGKNPKLGWCWAGNPHTWLGSASARQRIG